MARVSRLMVDRRRVVHGGRHARRRERRLHVGATRRVDEDGVLRPDAVAILSHGNGRGALHVGEQAAVARTECGPALEFPFKTLELGQHDRALQRVHSPTHAHPRVHVAPALPVHADLAAGSGERVVAREDRPAITVAAERLAREEAGAADRAQVAAAPAPVSGAEALRRVLDHRQIVARGDRANGVHVGALAVEAHRHQRAGARRDGGLDQRRIDVAGVRLDIDEHRHRAEQHDRLGRRREGERRRDDLVTGLKTDRHQADQKRLGAAGDGDAVGCAGGGRERRFELRHFGAHDVLAVVEHALDAGVNARLQRRVLALEVHERDRLEAYWSCFVLFPAAFAFGEAERAHGGAPTRWRRFMAARPRSRHRSAADSARRCQGTPPRQHRHRAAVPSARHDGSSSRHGGPARRRRARDRARRG